MEDKCVFYYSRTRLECRIIVDGILILVAVYFILSQKENLEALIFCIGIPLIISSIKDDIKILKGSGEFIFLDEEGIREKGHEKFLWKDITWIGTRAYRYGLMVSWVFCFKDSKEEGKIEHVEYICHSKKAEKIMRQYWEKYR